MLSLTGLGLLERPASSDRSRGADGDGNMPEECCETNGEDVTWRGWRQMGGSCDRRLRQAWEACRSSRSPPISVGLANFPLSLSRCEL